MHRIGHVRLVQVQTASLKVGAQPDIRYDPSPLRPVEHLLLATTGVVGVAADGERIMDIHNSQHPQARGGGAVSIGFTACYDAMRDRFGPHLHDGVAGENIIIHADSRYTLEQLGPMVVFRAPGADSAAQLRVLEPATPCAPFSRYALATPSPEPAALRNALQFLSHGCRGFYMAVATPGAVIRPGDDVFLLH